MTTCILNFSHPLPASVKKELTERIGEVREIVIPIQIDLTTDWTTEITKKAQYALIDCDEISIIINPPTLSSAAYLIGAILSFRVTNNAWSIPRKFMWTRWDNNAVPPKLMLGGIYTNPITHDGKTVET